MHDRQTIRTDATAWPVQILRALAITTAAVLLAYFFIDLPVLRFVRDAELHRSFLLRWLTRPPEFFVTLSPLVLVAGFIRRWFGPWTWIEKVAVAAAIATLLAALATLLLKMTFGRSGPDLVAASLDCGIYGFYPFHLSPAYWALPSGHTACTLSFTCVVKALIPQGRLLWWSISAIVPAAMVALSWHFVGDVLAGAFLGWAIAGTVVRWPGFGTPMSWGPEGNAR
jgi:hypothetical protein